MMPSWFLFTLRNFSTRNWIFLLTSSGFCNIKKLVKPIKTEEFQDTTYNTVVIDLPIYPRKILEILE